MCDIISVFLSDDDEVLMLKAQLGYLKKKLGSLGKSADVNDPSLPVIYVITPTHTRPGSFRLWPVKSIFLVNMSDEAPTTLNSPLER